VVEVDVGLRLDIDRRPGGSIEVSEGIVDEVEFF
jgi:hypothetical protein